jgi:murein DD-endopeptidase MepM/ murein hydrolase activator NlpD
MYVDVTNPRTSPRPSLYATVCARLRLPVLLAGVGLVLADLLLPGSALAPFAMVLLIVGLALYFRVGTPRAAPALVRPPVSGRWEAVNGPGSRVPSHGVHAWGQTYAIDLVRMPDGTAGRATGTRPDGSRPAEFRSFGEPVLAMGDGVVVDVRDGAHDHRSRSGRRGLLLFFVQATLRELRGPRGILGNWITVDLGTGRYALVAHLRRGSARVRVGDRVVAGQQIAECGNTGNSTEPHVHAQLMDTRHPSVAAGLPMRFVGVTGAGAGGGLLPANGGHLVNSQDR